MNRDGRCLIKISTICLVYFFHIYCMRKHIDCEKYNQKTSKDLHAFSTLKKTQNSKPYIINRIINRSKNCTIGVLKYLLKFNTRNIKKT